VIADGQHRNLGSIQIANDRHVAKHIRITRVVDLHAVAEFDYIAASFATVN